MENLNKISDNNLIGSSQEQSIHRNGGFMHVTGRQTFRKLIFMYFFMQTTNRSKSVIEWKP